VSNEFVLRQVDIGKDAEKLVEMWKASDNQWPGTWSGGTEITPQMVTEWHQRQKMIDTYVFEIGDKIAAYCSFNERPEEKNVGYVALLNVAPEYQGRSLGRKLLQRCLERCSELGFHLLTLGTWSGNLKSVPLYKKTGFYWVPDTDVWMLNFVPSILNLPCTRPFFSRHDWYKTFERALTQDEDDERWHVSATRPLIQKVEVRAGANTVVEVDETIRMTARLNGGQAQMMIAGDSGAGLSIYRAGNRIPIDYHIVGDDDSVLARGRMRYG